MCIWLHSCLSLTHFVTPLVAMVFLVRMCCRGLVEYRTEIGAQQLMCRTPRGEVLFKNLTFSVLPGQRYVNDMATLAVLSWRS